jgi:hypothetical protein
MAVVCAVGLFGTIVWLNWQGLPPGNPNGMGLRPATTAGSHQPGECMLFDITNAPADSQGHLMVFIQKSDRWILQRENRPAVVSITVPWSSGPSLAFVSLDSTNVPIRLVLECREKASSSFGRFAEEVATQIGAKLSGDYLPKHFGRSHQVTNEFNLHLLGDSQPR